MKLNRFHKLILLILFVGVTLFVSPSISKAQINNVNSTFGTTEAILNATITPNGYSTIGWFEYSTDSGLTNKMETERKYVGTTSNPVEFSQKITGLIPNTTYYFRVVTNNGRNTIKGNILSFVTVPNVVNTQTSVNTNYVQTSAPVYTQNQNCNCCLMCNQNQNTSNLITQGQGVRVVSPNAVELNATLTNNENAVAQAYFEWGQNTNFGNMTSTDNTNSGYSNNIVKVIDNLNPGTMYYYRVVFIKNGKTYTGNTKTFQTTTSTQNTYYQNNAVPVLTEAYQQNQNFNNIPVFTENNKTKTANSLFGDDFMPNDLFGWLIVIIILFSILFIIRRIITGSRNKQA